LIDNEFPSSIFNVGSGEARTWFDLARACYSAAGVPERIEFIDMPEEIRDRYQYYTKASMKKLRAVGYHDEFLSLEESIRLFWQKHLAASDPFL
jgi:ADP-L-glycero-D-manno-heptose 6-epimerase